MTLSTDESAKIKQQLISQVQNLPEQQKLTFIQQINSMNEQELESFVEQQKAQQQKIFRLIILGQIPSKKIYENQECIAVLDTKPISKGHIIIIPKTEVTQSYNLPLSLFKTSKQLAEHVRKKLNAQGTEIQTQFNFGEIILNIIPIYDKPLSTSSPRSETSEINLNELMNTLVYTPPPQPPTIIKQNITPTQILKLKRRIP